MNGQAAVIEHEAIPDVMEAMQMNFKLEDASELAALQPDDTIRFDLRIQGSDWSIANLEPLPPGTQLDLP